MNLPRKRLLELVPARRLAPLIALAGAGLYYGREVEPANVEVVSVELALPRLEAAFDGYRIAHVSDLHADGWMTPGRVLELVEFVNAEAPDLVVITGDFATYSFLQGPLIHHVPKLAAPLSRLRAPDGVLAVLGNHDHKTDDGVPKRAPGAARKEHDVPETVRRTLAAAGAKELRNTVHTLRRGEAALHLCGVDSVCWGEDRMGSVLFELPERGAAVLLVHEPDFADKSAATGRFDLQLSGHSHGGQVRLPLLGPPLLPPLGRRYPDGLYRVEDMLLYTNRGLGNHPRLRFNCRPEITLLTLRSPSTRSKPRQQHLPGMPMP